MVRSRGPRCSRSRQEPRPRTGGSRRDTACHAGREEKLPYFDEGQKWSQEARRKPQKEPSSTLFFLEKEGGGEKGGLDRLHTVVKLHPLQFFDCPFSPTKDTFDTVYERSETDKKQQERCFRFRNSEGNFRLRQGSDTGVSSNGGLCAGCNLATTSFSYLFAGPEIWASSVPPCMPVRGLSNRPSTK